MGTQPSRCCRLLFATEPPAILSQEDLITSPGRRIVRLEMPFPNIITDQLNHADGDRHESRGYGRWLYVQSNILRAFGKIGK